MKIAVIGAGSWGTALANILGKKGYNVSLWARRPEVVSAINTEHHNPRYLSDIELSENIVATLSHQDAVQFAKAVVVVTPSNLVRGVARALDGCCDASLPVVICSKGVEQDSGMLSTEVFAEEMGTPERLAVLSGPNHAEEVIKGVPAGTVIASQSQDTALFFQDLFASDTFRTYVSDDVTGVQLCAAFKNVIAIAVGISYGMGFGDNTASLLITRGIAEMNRLIKEAGGNPLTALGLAGVGDMIATCMSEHSRNRAFGRAFAQGESLESYQERTHMVVEGALACKTLKTLSDRYDIELPITDTVRGIVWEGAEIMEAAKLLGRPLKSETYGM